MNAKRTSVTPDGVLTDSNYFRIVAVGRVTHTVVRLVKLEGGHPWIY